MIRNRGHYWQVKVYAGRDPLTGQERREYGRASTKREAERLEAQLKAKVAEGRHRATAARTVADLLERWLEWRQGVKEISPTTLEDYRLQINRRIVPALGNLPVRRLDAETLDRFYAELRKRGRGDGKPLSASQVRSVHTVLSGALKQAVAWGWISHNPARLATPPSLPSGEVTPPPVAQVSRLLALALERELRFGLFLRLAVVLGARRGELCGLRWRAIDLRSCWSVAWSTCPASRSSRRRPRPAASAASPWTPGRWSCSGPTWRRCSERPTSWEARCGPMPSCSAASRMGHARCTRPA
jgi:integrase